MCCYLTRTTNRTHELIRENLHETPTYGGWVEAKGPRYCPSIEDKVYLFSFFLSESLKKQKEKEKACLSFFSQIHDTVL